MFLVYVLHTIIQLTALVSADRQKDLNEKFAVSALRFCAIFISYLSTTMKTNDTIKIEGDCISVALTSDASSRDGDTLSSGLLGRDEQTVSIPDGTVISIKEFSDSWFAAKQNYKSLIQAVYQKLGKRAEFNFVNEQTEYLKRPFWTSKVTIVGLESFGEEFLSTSNAPGHIPILTKDDKAFYGQVNEAQNAALKAAYEAISAKFKDMGVAPEWA